MSVVQPDDKANTGDASQRFTAGRILVFNGDMSAWYDKISEQAQSTPEFQIEGMDYCGANVLAAANFAAAHYGTKERMFVDYGAEGAHYTVRDGVPVKTDRDNQEVNNTWALLAGPGSLPRPARRAGSAPAPTPPAARAHALPQGSGRAGCLPRPAAPRRKHPVHRET